MARQRVNPDRAWFYREDTNVLTLAVPAVVVSAPIVVVNFEDLEGDIQTDLVRERSEWYTERIIMWFNVVWNPDTAPVNPTMYGVRLGQIDDTEGADTSSLFFTEQQAQRFGRIYQEDLIQIYPSESILVSEPAGLVGTSEALEAGSRGYLAVQAMHKWDLNVKSRVRVDASIVIQHGPMSANVFNADEFFLEYGLKILFRRGRSG